MRYAKTIMLLLSLLALSAVMASAASATEGTILSSTYPVKATTASTGTSTFETKNNVITVKCTSSEGTSETTSTVAGKFDELFLNCTAGGLKCTGLPDTTTGSILATGNIDYLHFTDAGGVLRLAIIFLLNPVHFECLGILTEVTGHVVGVLSEPSGTLTKKLTAVLTGAKGVQTPTVVNGVSYVLLSETNGGAFEPSSQLQTAVATAKAGEPEVTPMY